MYELRILTGLHRGATLPLDDQTLVIGASEDADVVLVDPGIEPEHAKLSRTDAGWVLSQMDGTVHAADSNREQAALDLASGEFARLGKVWITVTEQSAAWENPPPEPVDMEEEEAVHASAEGEHHELDASDGNADVGNDSNASGEDDSDSPATHDEATEARDGAAKDGAKRRRVRYILLPLAGCAVLSAAAALAMSIGSVAKTSSMEAERRMAQFHGANSASAPASQTATDNKGGNAVVSGPGESTAPQDFRPAFRKLLSDTGLIKRFDLKLDARSWSMRAALDDEEAARFERILSAFVDQHKITFPVVAHVGSAESMLPFKVHQVISGENASLVTKDGDRLYVGDEFRGVRVAAIENGRLTFVGKRKIEVQW